LRSQPGQQAVQDHPKVGPGGRRVGGAGDRQARLGEHGDDESRERAGRDRGYVASLDAAGQPLLKQAPAVPVNEVFPRLGAQDARPVDEDDPLEVGAARADIEERGDAVADLLQRRGCLGGELLVNQLGRHLRRSLRHGGAEQVGLVLEVVVQRAPGDACLGDDLLRGRAVEALRREQPARGGNERLPGVRRVLGAPRPGHARPHGG
jgi:hypothetical protein